MEPSYNEKNQDDKPGEREEVKGLVDEVDGGPLPLETKGYGPG
jgi:hypothetical protein